MKHAAMSERTMSRYRYDTKTDRMMVLNEATGEWKPARKTKGKVGAPSVMPDIKEFVTVAGHDTPVLISSRAKLRAYERSNNIRQCGDLKPGEIIARERARIAGSRDEARRLGGDTSVTWTDFR